MNIQHNQKDIDIVERTFKFSLRIIKLCDHLNQKGGSSYQISKQLIRSGTSIGANIEESQAAQSTADFIHKLEISQKEARETRYWLKLLIGSAKVPEQELLPLLKECNEIIAIITAIIVNTKKNNSKNNNKAK